MQTNTLFTPFSLRLSRRARTLCALAFAAFGISTLQATTMYTDQATFLNNVQSGYYLETFDSLPKGFVASPHAFSGNGFNYTASADHLNFYNTGPGSDVWLSTQDSNTNIIFNLTSNNVTAIGGYFFITDSLGQQAVPGTITVTLNDGSTFSILDPSATSFIGFTSSVPILSLTVTPTANMSPFTWAAINDFITGSAANGATVPDRGSSATLFAMALLVIFGIPRAFQLQHRAR